LLTRDKNAVINLSNRIVADDFKRHLKVVLAKERLIILGQHRPNQCKGKGQDTCYSTAYMSQTRDQQRFYNHGSGS